MNQPIVEITRRGEFCASHRLFNPDFSDERNREIYGKCENPNGHGHNYTVDVTLRGAVDPKTAMVMDLKYVKDVLRREVIDHLDHRHLNHDVDFLEGMIPTAENLAVAIFQRLEPPFPAGFLYRVRLWETPRNWVDFYGNRPEIDEPKPI